MYLPIQIWIDYAHAIDSVTSMLYVIKIYLGIASSSLLLFDLARRNSFNKGKEIDL
jgi:hypothetical protein